MPRPIQVVNRSVSLRRLKFALLMLLALAVGLQRARGADPAPKWEVLNKEATGAFIVSMARDLQGIVWVGAEDRGVFRYDPKAAEGQQWIQFNSKNGMGDDNAYAIAVDKLGRVWVGTLNRGVSVYNGDRWKTYDVLEGPIGERIFAIVTCPTDGDVWMATSAGLTRYSVVRDTWSYMTRADGLPEDQANALAFDAQGNLYVGTQCHGIAVARAADDYKQWTVQSGPVQLPTTPTGTGLPTPLINGLLAARNGTVYAATTAGLAWSKDKGKTWAYLRGRDYAAKVKGRSAGPPPAWREAPKAVMDSLLPEDYVTCLAESDDGLIWLGFRQQGYVALDPKNRAVVLSGTQKAERLPDDFATCILTMPENRPCIGTYGGGVARANTAMKAPGAKPEANAPSQKNDQTPPLPAAAKPPGLDQGKALLKQLDAPAKSKISGTYVTDDWRTQGDFYGADKLKHYRYGEWSARLCAFASPNDASWGRKGVACVGNIGSHHAKGDSIRNWVHWEQTDNPRSLKNPFMGGRRQSEWDDHGEAYPMSHEGPHLYVDIIMPDGAQYLAFYIFNKDGHEGNNRYRDYVITLKSQCASDAQFIAAPTLARSRVKDFWGGVYKVFAVPGGQKYTIEIHDNWSFNTILSGVFVDPIFDAPEDRLYEIYVPRVRHTFTVQEVEQLLKMAERQPMNSARQTLALVGQLQQLRSQSPLAYGRHTRLAYLQCLRALQAGDLPVPTLQRARAECLNQLRLFDRRDAIYAELDKTTK